jgi:hypothetical protein
MKMAFDRIVFDKSFKAALAKLSRSEKVTREVLSTLSRTVLEAIHATGDVGFVNQLVAVLTPVNKKVCRLFFKEFSGFMHDDQSGLFTKKSKKNYEKAKAAALAFLEDPHQNIWTWAERNIEIERKAWEVAQVTEFMARAIKKAEGQNLTKGDVLKAVIAGGFTVDDLIAVMDTMEGVEVKVN